MTQKLTHLRKQLDEIDDGILVLLDKRMKLAVKIAEVKKKIGKPILDIVREEDLFQKLKDRNKKTILPDEKMLEIWGKIVELSREMQERC
ncbi:chorismate mutase [Candidatus Gracilibacteria bacterium]|nr:chorismate mutase [Candidatus Gracilibacteria bacterium]